MVVAAEDQNPFGTRKDTNCFETGIDVELPCSVVTFAGRELSVREFGNVVHSVCWN